METIAIVGSREWRDRQRVTDYINALPENTVVVTGAWWGDGRSRPQPGETHDFVVRPTRGVDFFAATAARARGLQVILIPADFDKHGRQAGFRRNPIIIELGNRVAAFWDGKSNGTHNSIEHAQRLGKPIEIIKP